MASRYGAPSRAAVSVGAASPARSRSRSRPRRRSRCRRPGRPRRARRCTPRAARACPPASISARTSSDVRKGTSVRAPNQAPVGAAEAVRCRATRPQVGEQHPQVALRARGHGPREPVVQLGGVEPARGEVLGQRVARGRTLDLADAEGRRRCRPAARGRAAGRPGAVGVRRQVLVHERQPRPRAPVAEGPCGPGRRGSEEVETTVVRTSAASTADVGPRGFRGRRSVQRSGPRR